MVILDFVDNVFFFLMEPHCDQQLASSIECALILFILSFVTFFALIVLFETSWKFNLKIVTKLAVVATNCGFFNVGCFDIYFTAKRTFRETVVGVKSAL